MARKTKNPFKINKVDEKEEKFINAALKRFAEAEASENRFRKNAEDDMRFLAGQQWDSRTILDRQNSGRPCMTFNRLPAFVQQVTNELRQNKIAIQVDPIKDKGDIDTASVIAGLIKHIEEVSNADTHYDHASWYSVATGLGYLRVINEFEDSESFNQVLTITSISNPDTVYFDPFSTEADGSDAEYAFVIDDISIDEFENLYPDSKLASNLQEEGARGVFKNSLSAARGWYTENSVRVADYYYKDYKHETLYHILDNRTGIQEFTTEKPAKEDLQPQEYIGEDNETYESEPNVQILNQRPITTCTVKWCKINGNEILSTTDFPGKFIPVIPVKGDEYWVDGKKDKHGIIRNAKDAQRAYNFHANLQMEVVDLAPKSPYIGATGQFDDKEHMWRDANVVNFSYLEYNPVELNGQLVGPPQRQTYETPIQAISMTRMQAADDLKAITGIFDASLGAQGNETSGKAILARQQQSHTSNFHYQDNLARSIKQVGRILVNAIPTIYDAPRLIRIIKPDNTAELVAINNYADENKVAKNTQEGKKHLLNVGLYDVVIDTGPAYATRRQEAVESIMTLGEQYPQAMPLIADIAVSNMDWPGAKEIAARLKTAVPAAVLQATGENGNDPTAQIQQMSQQLQQATDQIQKLQAFSQELHMQLQTSNDENKLLKTKAQIDLEKAVSDRAIKEKQLKQDSEEIQLEYIIKVKELELAERELALKEAQLAINATVEANEMIKDAHDVHVQHLEIAGNLNSDHNSEDDNLKNAIDATDQDIAGFNKKTLD